MGERTEYAPGTFCWVDLGTSDQEAAKAFYSGIFGWEAEDMPVGEGRTYTMLRRGGRNVAAVYGMAGDQGPPAWLAYVSTDDLDAVVPRAEGLGATIIGAPFDVMQAGRMAVVQDPQGAVFAFWEAGANLGAGLVNDHGALTLNQLNTSDLDGAERFYTELLGWEFDHLDTEGGPGYVGIKNQGALNGGMMELPSGSPAAPHWLAYFGHDDLDAAQGPITEGGGAVVVPPLEIPSGRILVATDPQGAFFALFEGEMDP